MTPGGASGAFGHPPCFGVPRPHGACQAITRVRKLWKECS